MFGKKPSDEEDMYNHAKMSHIGLLKKKLMGLVADGHSEGHHTGDVEHASPDHEAADLAMSAHHGSGMGASPEMEEGSPEEEAGESAAEEASEDGGHGGMGPEDDELTKMKKAYFRPKAPTRRPGTAMVIAVAPKSSMPAPGAQGRGYGSKGKMK